MSLMEEAVGDGVELAGGGANVVVHEYSATFSTQGVRYLENRSQLGRSSSFGGSCRARRLRRGVNLDYRARITQVKRPPSLDVLAGGRFEDELGVPELPSVRAGICGVSDDQVRGIALGVLLQPADDKTTEDQ